MNLGHCLLVLTADVLCHLLDLEAVAGSVHVLQAHAGLTFAGFDHAKVAGGRTDLGTVE